MVHLLSAQHLFFLNMVQIPRHEGTLGAQLQLHSLLSSALMCTVSGQLKARTLYLGKETRCPLNKTLGEPQGRIERFGEEKNSSSLPGFQLRIVQPVTR